MKTILFDTTNLSRLPNSPGIYKFLNSKKTIIYVGKAKNLKKRVASYFTKSHISNRKTLRMVREIKDIELALVNSEFDALLLENNLIKEHQPKYNINLKDDKSFPFICITNERFPRVISTRRYNRVDGQYFGPYTNVKSMKSVLDLIRKLYTIRTCSLNLSVQNVKKKKFKVCLEYHLGNCLGPCEALQDEKEYAIEIEYIKEILNGNLTAVKNHYKQQMLRTASSLDFERAQFYKLRFEKIEKFQTKSIVVNQKLTDIDVFGIVSDELNVYINFLRIVNGAIKITDSIEVRKKLDETDAEVLQLIIQDAKSTYQGLSKEILTNVTLELWEEINIKVPLRGDKRKLVELSLKNALYFKKEKGVTTMPIRDENRVLKGLQTDLRLKTLPKHIECFDNSNIQGTNPVASMVCFHNGRPSKKNYRHYNIKSVVGADDFKSMKEIVNRRYFRLIEEKGPLPDLIIIDGGKGQLNAAKEALLDLGIYGKLSIIGIAKRLEEIYLPEDPFPVHLSKRSESLKVIQRIRDEAHRFAITFHRLKRNNSTLESSLDQIPGIGNLTREKLLIEFKSIRKIASASIQDLQKIIGQSKGKLVKNYFEEKKNHPNNEVV
ncbi:MAG: excinuclease ABC subunit UvrC [Bacteroidetes bacterium]|nr:excinuclease ABC subunit UvrC [Bacteroidota bacterium]MDA1118939.1 excinuclease ABC subunit UvrC [Bacteroidota bacterium]